MNKKFTVALVGRPNVGKSSIFNRISQKKVSVVHDKAGITRDRIYNVCFWQNADFLLIDTGGIVFTKATPLEERIRLQTEIAISEATLICLVVENEILSPVDTKIAKELLKSKKKILLIVNKTDNANNINYKHHKLGIEKMFYVSASHGTNFGELLNYISKFDKAKKSNYEDLRFCIVGLTNAGKSSIANKLLNTNRMIISDERNTTRDSTNSIIEYRDKKITLVDTPGLTIKKTRDTILRLSHLSGLFAINNSNICVLVIDIKDGITTEIKKISYLVSELNKPCIVILNKIDLKSLNIKKEKILVRDQLQNIKYAKILFTSALKDIDIDKILPSIIEISEKIKIIIPTNKINSSLQQIQFINSPNIIHNRQLKIFYGFQKKDTDIPTIVIYINDPTLLSENYRRYVKSKIYELFDLKYIPIRIRYKRRTSENSNFGKW